MGNSKTLHRIENGNILVLERIFNAPPAAVFKMYKDPEHLKNWWGPRGWELPVCKMDFRVGGQWIYCMKCVDKNQGQFYGMESWGKAVYHEIVEPKKIVMTDYFADAEGNVNKELPATKGTVEFIDQNGKTKLISRGEYASPEQLKTVMDMGMLEGISQTWDRLDELLAKKS